MGRTATYYTVVTWKGEHWGHVVMGNGPEMDFSAPPDAHGHPGVLTPEDAFVAAVNTCIMMMFIWAVERFKLDLVSYECRAEGTKLIELDRTEIFTHVRLWPKIVVRAGGEDPAAVEKRVRRALEGARKLPKRLRGIGHRSSPWCCWPLWRSSLSGQCWPGITPRESRPSASGGGVLRPGRRPGAPGRR